jgi:CyaY protein
MNSHALDDSRYHTLADATFARIEQRLDDADLDFEVSGGVLTIEMDDGSKIILNRQPPVHEIWLAAKSGGFHFAWDGERWFSKRESASLDELLHSCIRLQGGPELSAP